MMRVNRVRGLERNSVDDHSCTEKKNPPACYSEGLSKKQRAGADSGHPSARALCVVVQAAICDGGAS